MSDEANYLRFVACGSARPLGSAYATQQRTIEFLLHQVTSVGSVAAKPIFCEYSVCFDGKMIGSVCDDQPFL